MKFTRPASWRRQPQYPADLKPLPGLVFAVNAATMLDAASGVLANVGISGTATTNKTPGAAGVGIAVLSQTAGGTLYPRWKYRPEQRFGAGDFTIRVLLSAQSSAGDAGAVFSNHGGTAQWRVLVNYLAQGTNSGTYATSAGAVSLLTYGGAVFASVGAAGMLDGLPHLYEFRRRGNVHTMLRDGCIVDQRTMTAQNATGTKTVGPALYWNLNGDETAPSADYSGSATIFAADIWNRALETGELGGMWDVYTKRVAWYADVGVGSPASGVGLAVESDSALARAATQSRAVGVATETDAALARAATQAKATGLATQTDTALALAPGAAPGTVGTATQTDQALALAGRQSRVVGLAAETDTALARTAGAAVLVGMALEIDAAFALVPTQRRAVGLAVEADTALPLLPDGAVDYQGVPLFTRKLTDSVTRRIGSTVEGAARRIGSGSL